jgi:hypothetical protein
LHGSIFFPELQVCDVLNVAELVLSLVELRFFFWTRQFYLLYQKKTLHSHKNTQRQPVHSNDMFSWFSKDNSSSKTVASSSAPVATTTPTVATAPAAAAAPLAKASAPLPAAPVADDAAALAGHHASMAAAAQKAMAEPPTALERIMGAPPANASAELIARVRSRSNRLHSSLDLLFGTTAYTFGALMQFSGQGTLLSFFSMWGAGSYYFITSQLRCTRGPTPDAWQGEATAAWLWMFASMQQFKQHGRLKWAGYSSWTGFMLASYYSARTIYAYMV